MKKITYFWKQNNRYKFLTCLIVLFILSAITCLVHSWVGNAMDTFPSGDPSIWKGGGVLGWGLRRVATLACIKSLYLLILFSDCEEELGGLTQDWITLTKHKGEMIIRKQDLEIL